MNESIRGQLRAPALLVLAMSAFACDDRGIVGVTSSTVRPERDAMVLPDAAGSPDGSVTRIDDCLPVNAANLDAATAQQLIDGTGDASSMSFLYPYDGTVFPQGIAAPLLMWSGENADAVYVRLHSTGFDYRGCLKPTGTDLLELPASVWNVAAASTKGASDPFTLELKVLTGETIYGPISEQLVIANGKLAGSVYYMTTVSTFSVGAIMRIPAGRPVEPFLDSANCNGCHSASANGTRLLAYSSGGGSSYTVSASAPVAPLFSPTPGAEFSAVYPDGSVYVASAHPTGGAGPRTYGGGVTNAGLYDTATGALVSDSGLPIGASMPSFSPDGAQLAFTDFGATNGTTLSSMSFSIATRTAFGPRRLYTSTTGGFAGWPAFLPDGKGIIFTVGAASDFSGEGVGLHPGGLPGPSTDVFVVDAASGTATMLAQAMGFHSPEEVTATQTYLPGGTADLHQNYYPTVSPSPSGGYAWAFFDSARTYGNLGAHRAIWGTAISVSPGGTYVTDPSHPAFYLPGQDLTTPNFRAVAVLDPCGPDAGTCASTGATN
jgi:hypothetical protein